MRALANGSPDTTSTQRVTLHTSQQTPYTDNLGSSAVNQFVEYHVTPMLTAGTAPTVVSGLVMVPAATTTTTSTTGTNSSTSAFTGSTTFTAATPAAIKTGMTASLASVAGISGARWVSLNESVATVDASGTVTGRAGGSTQVVALSAAPDGSLRVVAVPVTVTP